jgi:hypothetical protein
MLDATKSLIYNIYLMAGQTGNYDLRAAGLKAQMTPLTERYRLVQGSDTGLPSDGNMRHRSRTFRTNAGVLVI